MLSVLRVFKEDQREEDRSG